MTVRNLFRLLSMALVASVVGGCGKGSSPSAPGSSSGVGSLQLEVTGLPEGTDADVLLTGSGYETNLSGSQLIESIPAGRYALSASTVAGASESYTPSPPEQEVEIRADQTAEAGILYLSSGGSGLDLRILKAYLVQASQRLDGTVPLMAGRPALLRVFATANRAAVARPAVELSLVNSQGVSVTRIAAPSPTMPTSLDEGALEDSWNLLIPGTQVESGMTIRMRIDPDDEYAETDEGNNAFPTDGKARPVDVRDLPDLAMHFLPVHQNSNASTGDVRAGNVDAYMEMVQKLHPLSGYDATVGPVYTTDAPPLLPDDANDAWESILNEIWVLQQRDALRARHYYGVVHVDYNSGVAGIGFIGAPAALGRELIHPVLAAVLPHEFGHNLGLPHADCGVSGGDPDYPYANGAIGVYGYDLELELLKTPSFSDIMGYCEDAWISDYNFEKALAYREENAKLDEAGRPGGPEPCYLVWGRMDARGVVLEPVLEIDAHALLPSGGPNRLLLELDDGSSRSVAFEAVEVADGPRGLSFQFAYFLPAADLGPAALRTVQVTTEAGARASRQAAPLSSSKAGLRAYRLAPDRVQLVWDPAVRPMLCVVDGQSGEILSLARSGRTELVTRGKELSISASDGVRSERLSLALPD